MRCWTDGLSASLIAPPDALIPKFSHVPCGHHGQFWVTVRDAFKLQEFCLAPSAHEFAMPAPVVAIARVEKPFSIGKSDVGVENVFDIAELQEIKECLSTALLDIKHIVPSGIWAKRIDFTAKVLRKRLGFFSFQTGRYAHEADPENRSHHGRFTWGYIERFKMGTDCVLEAVVDRTSGKIPAMDSSPDSEQSFPFEQPRCLPEGGAGNAEFGD